MNMLTRCVFDLDNTLIYTDALNNDAYNYALSSAGVSPIFGYKRVTREVVFTKYPELNSSQIDEIIKSKQKYFINNLDRTIPNTYLFQILISQGADKSILWTSADETRTLAVLNHYKIHNAFKKIIISNKREILPEINRICDYFNCSAEHLNFYEDNYSIVENLKKLKLRVTPIEPRE